MMKSTKLYTATYYMVASSGTYTGTGINKSPKKALAAAELAAYTALTTVDMAIGCCSGIAVDGWRMWRGSNLLAQVDNV